MLDFYVPCFPQKTSFIWIELLHFSSILLGQMDILKKFLIDPILQHLWRSVT